jgi:transmembrane 9 superfamily protein 3
MLIVFVVLIIVTVCVSVVSTYILLNNEGMYLYHFHFVILIRLDYRWQWVSFFSCASTSVYTFIYSVFYYSRMSKMNGFFQTSFYFGYILIICFGFALFLGICLLILVNYFS